MERHGNRAPLPSRCPPASAGGFYANGAFPREAPSRLNKSPERKRRDTGTTPPAVDTLPRVHGRTPVFRVQTARQDAVRSTSGRRPAKRLHEDRHSPVEAAGCRCFACRLHGRMPCAAPAGGGPPSENRQDAGVSRVFSASVSASRGARRWPPSRWWSPP